MDPTTLPLKDIHLPDPIGWWPLALGWWLLGIALLGLVVAATTYWVWRRRQRPLRQALASLDQARACLGRGQINAGLQLISQTLRRTAITLAGEAVSGLTGDAWLAWLDSRWQRQGFRGGAGRLISSGPYRSPGSVNNEQAVDLLELACAWTHAQRIGGRQS